MVANNTLQITKTEKEKIEKAKEWVVTNIPNVKKIVVTAVSNNDENKGFILAIIVTGNDVTASKHKTYEYNAVHPHEILHVITTDEANEDSSILGSVEV